MSILSLLGRMQQKAKFKHLGSLWGQCSFASQVFFTVSAKVSDR
jgi:hypothetical protein